MTVRAGNNTSWRLIRVLSMPLATAGDSGDTLDRSKENHVMAGLIQVLTFFQIYPESVKEVLEFVKTATKTYS